MNKVSISLVIPVYNVEKYLEACLESVTKQIDTFCDIILVNDGSTDKSKEICESYEKQYKNIILINQENKGLAEARNVGIKYAKGQYILFLDSDDMLDLNAGKLLKEQLCCNELDVLYYKTKVQYDINMNGKSNLYTRNEKLHWNIVTGMEFFDKSFPQNYIASACLAVYRKEFLYENDIKFPKGLYFEDGFFYIQIVMNAKHVMTIPDEIYIRRYREESIMTSTVNYKKCEDIVKGQYLIWNYILDRIRIFESNTDLFKEYFISNLISAYNILSEYNKDDKIDCLIKEYKNHFWKLFSHFYKHKNLSWSEANALCWLSRDIDEEFFNHIYNVLLAYIKQKMDSMMLHIKEKKIGIYGIGKHTMALLNIYSMLYGEINADIYFVVSEKKVDYFMGEKVYLCSELPQEIDLFVISSKIYQDGMYAELEKQNIDAEKICMFYQKHDICDLVVSEKILKWITKGKYNNLKNC